MRKIYVDCETTGLDPRKDTVQLIQLNENNKVTLLKTSEYPEAMQQLVEICENPEIMIIGHNLTFDLSFVRVYANRRVKFTNIYDTMLAEQVILAGWGIPYLDKKTEELKTKRPEFSLKALCSRHLGIDLDKSLQASDWGNAELTEAQMEYASRDVEVLPALQEIQENLLNADGLRHIAQLEFDTIPAIVEMQVTGMPFSWDEAEKLRVIKKQETAKAVDDLEKEVRSKQATHQVTLFGDVVGVDVNFNSPVQIKKYLKDKLGLDVDSSDVETLKGIDHPFAAKLLKYRGLEKQLQFFDQFEEYGAKSGRLYPFINQCRAATGRMSSSRPNQQQVPKRGEGKVFRNLFKCKPGYKMVKVDYSAIEMRVTAAVSKDPAMLEAINTGVDLHKLTASKTSRKPMEEITKEDRQKAKAVNFGLCFGMSAPTLKKYSWFNYQVKMTDEEALETRDAYFNLYKGVAKWHENEKSKMRYPREVHLHTAERGYYTQYLVEQRTILGRRRAWPNFMGESLARMTEMCNTRVQGSAADLTKLALIQLYNELPEEARLIGVIHDEILVECSTEIAEDIKNLMLKCMCEPGNKMCDPVKIEAEGGVGDAWGS